MNQAWKEIRDRIEIGYILYEKCEFQKARETFWDARQRLKDMDSECHSSAIWREFMIETVSGLLRLAGEALDWEEIQNLDREVNALLITHPKDVPAEIWLCKGVIARQQEKYKLAQKQFHRYLRAVRDPNWKPGYLTVHGSQEAMIARSWISLAAAWLSRGHTQGTEYLAHILLKRFESKRYKYVSGLLYLILGKICEKRSDLASSQKWYKKAQIQFLSERHWYYHLYVLLGFAEIARMQQNYTQAYQYLDWISQIASGPECAALQLDIHEARQRLEEDAVDIIVDSQRGFLKTRGGKEVSLRKQFVLLNLLQVLSKAHSQPGDELDRGVSKAEMIEKVWEEQYNPPIHDNKLYYNINRLRKLIEPDFHHPRYLVKWKHGYRFAPGLRVQWIGSQHDLHKQTQHQIIQRGNKDDVQ